MQWQTFAHYEIIRKLSRSMTDVYLANETPLQRNVVLKLIEHSNDEFTQLVIAAERRGAELQRQLKKLDERILEIYEYGEQDGCFFVAMEYFPGKTLAEILKAERMIEPVRAARYAAEICNQLRILHAFVSDMDGRKTAVVHGDIKPSNVQVGANDELRLLDFGIAKVVTFTHNLTHHVLGSPSYCSPERLSKSQVDQHSDLWAVGVSLYEMVGGTPPYQAENTRKLEHLIQSRRPPRELPDGCPGALKAIVGKALAGDVVQRYQSAEAFENDLSAYLKGQVTVAEAERATAGDAHVRFPGSPEAPTKRAPARAEAQNRGPQQAVQKRRPNDLSNIAIASLAGVLVGLLLFIPIGYYYRFRSLAGKLEGPRDYAHESLQYVRGDWSLYQQIVERNKFLRKLSPALALRGPMRTNLLAGADNILESFRNSSDAQLGDFDWVKARQCLRYALEIEPSDLKAKGELALCNGYLKLRENTRGAKAALSIDDFRQAGSYLPRLPDAHLGLARVYVYTFHNIGQALAEFHQAEQLGYKLGPRETEEKADGYLFRAQWAITKAKRLPLSNTEQRSQWLDLAHDDAERARRLYAPLAGFSNVNASLEQLGENRAEQAELKAVNDRKTKPPRRVMTRFAGLRRWR